MSSNIDAIIAQGPRPVQTDPNGIANRIITLRQAMQGQQLQQEQIQAAQQENQQRAIQMDQTRALNNAYQAALTVDPSTGQASIDRNTLTQALSKAGHGSAIPAIMQSLNAYDKSNIDLQTARTGLAKAEAEHAGSLGASVRAAKYDPQLFLTLTSDAVRQKHVEPQLVAPMIDQVQKAMQADPSGAQARQVVQRFSDQMIAGSEKQRELDNAQQTADARMKTANVDTDKAQLAKDTAYLQRVGGVQSQAQLDQLRGNAKAAGVSDAAIAQIPGMYSPAAMQSLNQSNMTADQRATTSQAATNQIETARHNQADEAAATTRNNIAGGELGINAGRLTLEKEKAGFEMSGGVSTTAKMAAAGKIAPATLRLLLRSQPGLLAQIQQLDPEFDEGNLDNRYNVINDYGKSTPGSLGSQAVALNTMIHHADLYKQAALALKNGTFKPGNAAWNAVADAFGKAPPTNAALVGQFFAGETAKVAGESTEGSINKLLEGLKTNASPDQINGAADTLLQIAAGRAQPLIEKVQGAKAQNVVHIIGDDAKQILQRNGFNPDTMKPVQHGAAAGEITIQAADGSTHYFKTEAQAKTFEDNVKKAGGTSKRIN